VPQATTASVVAVAGAAATSAGAAASQPRRGGTLTAATQTDWIGFDNIYNSANGSAALMVFDPLFFYKADDKGVWHVTPGLIEKWDFADSSATWQLRKGVTFHDGTPWNADALKWNIERMLSDPKSLAASVLGSLDPKNPVTVVDQTTVKINLVRPAPSLVEQLSAGSDSAQYTYPISPTAFQKMGADQFNRTPVGTGPMKLAEWKPSDRVILQRYENYWMDGADGKALPYLDGITYRLIIDDSVRAIELKSHNIDFTDLIAPSGIADIKADPQLQLIEGRWAGNSRRLIYHAGGGPFADNLKLRQAVLYSIDRETLSTTLGQGQGDPSKYMLLPGSLGYDESLPYYWYDLDRARSLMNEAGYPTGLDVSFIIIAREVDKVQAEVLKQMWAQIGVRASIEAVERAALNQRILSGGAGYQVTSGQYGNYAGDADVQFRRYMHSKGGFNKAHMNNPEFDALLDRASGTYDINTRASLYHDAQTMDFNSLSYYGYLWTQWYNWALNKRVMNLPPLMGGAWDLRGVWLNA
jgi:peptide/nickel transport system substrate-binding protein